MFLSQLKSPGGDRAVAARDNDSAWIVPGVRSTRDLAGAAIAAGRGLKAELTARGRGDAVDLAAALAQGRILLPLDHDDPAHLHLTGTGLTHLGSAATRNSMHAKSDAESLTDSMKMFRMGLEGGKPQGGAVGVQPEWFYKGNGANAVAPGAALVSPGFALDAGEEPEIAGLYLIGPDGTPFRLGFALANEFSDHVTERGNYLWLAHSKLRPASYGPEMLVGDLPPHVEGTSRILRGGRAIWEKPFLSGESNMSHSLANLEHHHFKYALFRQPGDVHVHFFGTATLSFADGIKAQAGDVFQIESPAFGLPLSNPLDQQNGEALVAVATL
ncbi:AraD1 family protein [Paracoccus shandongensis]|uniref:AraD1 family protein n=1 Tax=Paracoccus shandongensis TaxID=2816048 RepID=UPI001A8D3B46|nr:AraD1 family protein [Paracoccus shandongensis]